MEDHDLLLARQLQSEFDRESALSEVAKNGPSNNKQTNSTENDCPSYQGGLSVIDPSWETTDPNPDVRALFLQYNTQYFWGKLAGVEVRWSPRMTLCAGVCHYEGHGGLCSIRLSVPLLKLRPRKDLVETLLHEMIHAYLFVTNNDRDRDGHGPNFQKHMHRINKESGAKITIYHSFHDEVDNYRQHWWRCNGPCKSRPPYYGWVKRAMNRAPSAHDFWWEDHVKSCGGTYTKVKEPEGYGEKKKGGKESKKEEATKSESQGATMDIRGFLGKGYTTGSTKQPGSSKPSGSTKTIPSTVTNSQDKPVTAATPADDFSPGVSDWQGGIWSPDKPPKQSSGTQPSNKQTDATLDKPTKQSSETQSSNKQTGGSSLERNNTQSKAGNAASNGQKNWTVVENEKDKANKSNISVGATSQSGNSGQVLGQSNGDGLSWLARMRKQWAQERTESSSSSPKTNHVTPCSQTKELKSVNHEKSVQKSGCNISPIKEKMIKNDNETDETQCVKVRNNISMSSSEGSHHSSFHVSSCEEDNWPSPDKYDIKHKNVQPSPVKKLRRKRVVLDLTSSDEEDIDFQAAPKRTKSVGKLKSHEQNGVTGEGDSDDHGKFKPNSISKNNRDNVKNANKTKISQLHVKGASKNTSEGRGSENGSTSRVGTSGSESNTSSSGASSLSVTQSNTASSSLVPCPVCQTKVPADDINRHLDACLS